MELLDFSQALRKSPSAWEVLAISLVDGLVACKELVGIADGVDFDRVQRGAERAADGYDCDVDMLQYARLHGGAAAFHYRLNLRTDTMWDWAKN